MIEIEACDFVEIEVSDLFRGFDALFLLIGRENYSIFCIVVVVVGFFFFFWISQMLCSNEFRKVFVI